MKIHLLFQPSRPAHCRPRRLPWCSHNRSAIGTSKKKCYIAKRERTYPKTLRITLWRVSWRRWRCCARSWMRGGESLNVKIWVRRHGNRWAHCGTQYSVVGYKDVVLCKGIRADRENAFRPALHIKHVLIRFYFILFFCWSVCATLNRRKETGLPCPLWTASRPPGRA